MFDGWVNFPFELLPGVQSSPPQDGTTFLFTSGTAFRIVISQKLCDIKIMPFIVFLIEKGGLPNWYNGNMGQSIQEWTKWNLWKTAVQKLEVIWSA